MEFIIFLVVLTVFSLLIGNWASEWGRSAGGWFCFAFIISPLIAAIVLLICGRYKGNDAPQKTCPHCAETINMAATTCKHCKTVLK